MIKQAQKKLVREASQAMRDAGLTGAGYTLACTQSRGTCHLRFVILTPGKAPVQDGGITVSGSPRSRRVDQNFRTQWQQAVCAACHHLVYVAGAGKGG